MRKYLAVTSTLFKAQLVYRFEVAMTAVSSVGTVLFAWVLWGAAFSERTAIGGFTYQDMLSYYVISSFIVSIDKSNNVCFEVSKKIRGGTFSKYMTIPANPQLYFLFQSFGVSAYYALFALLSALFSVGAFGVKLSFSSDPASVLCAILLVPLGISFMVSLRYFIGLLTFKFQDIGFFIHVQSGSVTFITGSIIPIVLLPKTVQSILRFLPFSHVIYTPAALLAGQTDATAGFSGLLVLLGWTAIMAVMNEAVYNRLRVKFDGVGV